MKRRGLWMLLALSVGLFGCVTEPEVEETATEPGVEPTAEVATDTEAAGEPAPEVAGEEQGGDELPAAMVGRWREAAPANAPAADNQAPPATLWIQPDGAITAAEGVLNGSGRLEVAPAEEGRYRASFIYLAGDDPNAAEGATVELLIEVAEDGQSMTTQKLDDPTGEVLRWTKVE